MVIQHNMAALFANQYNTINQKNIKTNTEKLASGYQINRAGDNAAGLTISEKMRWQIRGLNKASTNIQDGISLTNVADGALNEVHAILQRQRELLVQAANDTNTTADRQAIEEELSEISKEYDRIFNDTEFNTLKVFKGTDTVVGSPSSSVTPFGPDTLASETIGPTTTSKIVWLDQPPTADDQAPQTTSKTATTTDIAYSESEKTVGTNSIGHNTIENTQSVTTTITTVDETTTTQSTYADQSNTDYTKLKAPGDMTGQNGYINVTNKTGDLALSCAMSQLGVKVTDASGETILSTLDLYNNGNINKSTTFSADNNTATTVYDLVPGLTITQKIQLNGDKYDISYSLKNTSATSYNVSARLAFDVMNTSHKTANADGSYTLASEHATVDVSASGASRSGLGSINELYVNWDDLGGENFHTGFGAWWNNKPVASGGSTTIGSVSYGPIKLTSTPYLVTTTTTTVKSKTVQGTVAETKKQFEPSFLDIQAGSLAYQNIPIRLWDLSASAIGADTPGHISAFDADNSLDSCDNAIDKISSIRSYYGAMTNRLEHAFNTDTNTAENTQAAESILRDANMAKEMIELSKNNIIAQAADAMLANSNRNPSNILSLLQG